MSCQIHNIKCNYNTYLHIVHADQVRLHLQRGIEHRQGTGNSGVAGVADGVHGGGIGVQVQVVGSAGHLAMDL